MKKIATFAALFVLLAASTFYFTACSKAGAKKKENKDLVRGITAVHQIDHTRIEQLDNLKNLKPAEIEPYLQKNWPTLKADVRANVTRVNTNNDFYLKPTDSVIDIKFLFGSSKDSSFQAVDKNMVKHTGHFENKLIAKFVLYQHAPKYFFVECTNGLSEPADSTWLKNMHQFNFSESFTISILGESLMDHVNFDDAMHFGKNNNMPVFLINKETDQKDEVQYKTAWKYKFKTNKYEVMIPVFLGDVCNITNMTYTAKYHPKRNFKN